MQQSVEIASGIADITPQWLTTALQRDGINGQVSVVAASAIGTGQIGSCYRLIVEYASGIGPSSLVVKLPSDDPQRRTSDAFTYRCEVNFYREIAPRVTVSRPRCYYAALSDSGEEFTLLLEDLAPARQGDQIDGCTLAQARAAVVNLAGLHGPLWCDTSLAGFDWLVPNGSDFAELSATFYQDATEKFLHRYQLTDETTSVLTAFAKHAQSWWECQPRTFALLHGDYRLDNLMFGGTGDHPSVVAIDWQSCTVGNPLRDVAFMIVTGLPLDARPAAERDLVDAYWTALRQVGVHGYDPDECWADYRLGVFHAAVVSVFGATAAKPSARGDRMFTMMAERTARAITELDCLSLL